MSVKQNMFHRNRDLQPTVDYISAYTSDGRVFTISDKLVLPGNTTLRVVGTTDGLNVIFPAWNITSNLTGIDVTFHEDITISSAGTPTVGICRNRRDVREHSLSVQIDPTVSDEGTILFSSSILTLAGGTSSNRIISSASDPLSWYLNRDTNYMWKFVNTTANDATMLVEFDWVEE